MGLERLALAAVVVGATAGCIGTGDTGGNDVNEIDCTGLVCDWATKEGTPHFAETWHDGDRGVDLSDPGRVVIELKDVFFVTQHDRQLVIRAVMVRDPAAVISFEIDFFAAGNGTSGTFWDKSPVYLTTRKVDVPDHGVFQFHRPVLVPSEGAAVVLRVIKDGSGQAMIDEISLGK
jgi:hypothetical protein